MDLLNNIVRNPIDPEYRTAAAKGPSAPAPIWAVVALTALIGALFTVSALQTTRSAPALEREREQLIVRVKEAEQRHDALEDQAEALRRETEQLRAVILERDEGARITRAGLDRLGPITGDVPVVGPGLTIIVDDAPVAREDNLNRVLDRDLQILVNGLWWSGAEAIAINGHRLSALTAIRSAGDAITVDYRSLTRPYRIEAIGDPRTLAARFTDSTGGQLWQGLRENYRMRFDVSRSEELELRADPGLVLKHARRAQ